jgi:streptogramin lyase
MKPIGTNPFQQYAPCVALLWLLATVACAQQHRWHFQYYPPGDGQSFFEAYGAVQDKYGMVWFYGDGVAGYYDGYRHYSVVPAPGRGMAVPNELVRSYLKDRAGDLWAIGPRYTARFDHETGAFEVFQFPEDDPKIRLPDGSLLTQKPDWKFFDNEGNHWVAFDGSMYSLQPDKGEFRAEKTQFASSKNKDGVKAAFCLDSRGVTWVVNSQGKVETLEKGGKEFLSFTGIPGLQLPVTGEVLPHISEDHQGRIWIVSSEQAWVYDPQTRRYETFLPRVCGGEGLQGKGFYRAYHDASGVHWIGGVNGVTMISESNSPFSIWNNPLDSVEERTFALLEASDGTVWAGVRNSGLYHLTPELEILAYFQLQSDAKGYRMGNGVTSLLEDSAGTLWVGTYGMGLFRFDVRRRRLVPMLMRPEDPAALPTAQGFRTSLTDREGNLWFARCNGISVWQPHMRRFKNIDLPGRKASDPCSHVYALVESSDGRIWIGESTPAFYRYDPKAETFETFQLPFDRTFVFAFHEDSGTSTLWLGAEDKGLIHYSPSERRVLAQFSTESGLPCNGVTAIQKDAQGDFWLATCGGVSKFDPKSKRFENFDENQHIGGLLSGAWFQSKKSGKIYFGMGDGLLVFHPDSVEANKRQSFIPPLRIPSVKISGIEKYLPPDAAELTLQPGETNLELHFATLDYRFPNQKRYTFYLENLERTWGDTLAEPTAVYTHLRPGSYMFHLRGTDSFGNWLNGERTLRVRVRPYWWQAWWFKWGAATAVAGLLGWLAWYLVRRREAALRKASQEALLAAQRYQILPHFVFNSLNAANEFLTEDDVAGANKFITGFAELMHLHLGDLRQEFLPLSQERRFLSLYLEVLHRRYRDKFNYHIEADEALAALDPAIPAMLVQPFVENAIQHGLRPLDRKGFLVIRFFRNREELICEVQDNGVGRKRAAALGEGMPGHHHLGLENVQNRIALLNQLYRAGISFRMEDLIFENGAPAGTKAVLRWRFQKYVPTKTN